MRERNRNPGSVESRKMADSQRPNGRPKPARVAVVAAGVVSPLGFGLEETTASLRAGRDCVSPLEHFSVEHCRCKTAAQIPDARLKEFGGKDRRGKRLHRAAEMMIAAMQEALAQAPDFKPDLTQ